jgi:Na+/H+ antiporter NhaA
MTGPRLPLTVVPPRPGPPLRVQIRPVAPSLRRFLATEAGSAVLLLGATVVALLWANSPWSASYRTLWSTTAGFHVGNASLELDLLHWVNDAAMVVFFTTIALEISREVTTGELRERRTVAVPALGAFAGLAVPALIYFAFTHGTAAAHGWGIVMSTDTAFLIGILALFGPRCPDQLRLFLLTLAVVDDIGAITVMAVFYTPSVHAWPLAIAGAVVVLVLVMRWLGVWQLFPYVLAGIGLWFAVQASGVQATLAGVALGLLVPAVAPKRRQVQDVSRFVRLLELDTTAEREHQTELAARAAIPVNERLQRVLHPWSGFVVVPLFALANAGVRLSASAMHDAMTSPVSIGIAVSLVVGDTIGVFVASWIALRTGLGVLPGRVRYGHLLGGAILCGIGFTISLFVTELAFTDEALKSQAKIGILAGSLVAAVLGTLVLRFFGERSTLCSPGVEALPAALPPRPWVSPTPA